MKIYLPVIRRRLRSAYHRYTVGINKSIHDRANYHNGLTSWAHSFVIKYASSGGLIISSNTAAIGWGRSRTLSSQCTSFWVNSWSKSSKTR
jgi:hypothetical protein